MKPPRWQLARVLKTGDTVWVETKKPHVAFPIDKEGKICGDARRYLCANVIAPVGDYKYRGIKPSDVELLPVFAHRVRIYRDPEEWRRSYHAKVVGTKQKSRAVPVLRHSAVMR